MKLASTVFCTKGHFQNHPGSFRPSLLLILVLCCVRRICLHFDPFDIQADGSEVLWSQDKNNLTGFPARNLPFYPCRLSPAGSDVLQAQGADPICKIAQSSTGLQYEKEFDVTELTPRKLTGLSQDHRLATRKPHDEPL